MTGHARGAAPMKSTPPCRGCGASLPEIPAGRMRRSRYHLRCQPQKAGQPLRRRTPLRRTRLTRTRRLDPSPPRVLGPLPTISGWHALAECIRDRDGRRCLRCGRPEAENGRRLIVDHVRPRRELLTAGERLDDPRWLASLCHRCGGVKAGIERRARRGDLLDQRRYEALAAASRRSHGRA